MPGANKILPFAQGGGALVQSQAAYLADTQRPLGNQPGIARPDFVNKALLQFAAVTAGIAQFTADNQGTDVTDALVPSAMAALFETAMRASMTVQQQANQDLTSASAGYIKLPGGLILQWVTGNSDSSGNLSVALPVAFTTLILGGIANEVNPSGWPSTTLATVWAFDAATSTLTNAYARVRQVANGGVVNTAAGIGGRILAWGK